MLEAVCMVKTSKIASVEVVVTFNFLSHLFKARLRLTLG